MRKILITLVSAAVVSVGTGARADSCRGDLYCDGRRPGEGECKIGGIIIPCAAGDATVDETLQP